MRSIAPALVALLVVPLANSASSGTAVPAARNEEVRVASPDAGIELAGTLSLPAGAGPYSAALLITGNGPHTRDQRISDSPMFAMLAEHLVGRGLAVLRTDARGFGESTGPDDWEQTTTSERTRDNRAVLAYLRARPEIDPERIVLIGHSEGAMIAAALAASGESVALDVLLSTSALPGGEVIARQMSDNLLRRGAAPETAEAVRQQLLRFMDFLVNDRDNRPRFEEISLDFLVAHGVPREEADPALAQSLLEGFLESPWNIEFAGLDPRDDLRRIACPVFAVYGGADTNVPPRWHLPSLVEALTAGGLADFSTVVLPGQDHFLLEFEGEPREEHEPGRMELSNEFLDVLDAELARRGLSKASAAHVDRGGT